MSNREKIDNLNEKNIRLWTSLRGIKTYPEISEPDKQRLKSIFKEVSDWSENLSSMFNWETMSVEESIQIERIVDGWTRFSWRFAGTDNLLEQPIDFDIPKCSREAVENYIKKYNIADRLKDFFSISPT